MRAFLYVVASIGMVFPMAGVAAEPSPATLGLHLSPCIQGRSKVAAECGTFGVYENRVAKSGRIIELRVVVLKAKHPSGRAIAYIEGGPGASAVDDAPYIADGDLEPELLKLLRDRDILFVDARGMGASHPFDCDLTPVKDPASYFAHLFPDDIVKACYARSLATSDPNFYNTTNAVDDLDDVRAALGYQKLVLAGGSYGTYLALIYMRQHPDRVAAALLDGVDPPHFSPLPGAPDGAQTALNDLIEKCRKDAACRKEFPDFQAHFNAVLQRFAAGPIPVPLHNAKMTSSQTVLLSKEVFVDHLRQVLYNPESAAYVPYAIERAYQKDYVPLGRMIDFIARAIAGDLNMGAWLSYTCSDEIPFITDAAIRTAAANSFAGDLRVRAQQHACTIWNVRPMPADFDDAVRSDAPVLMISGSDDPATPPQYGTQALQELPNGKEILVRGGGHGNFSPCVLRLELQFVRDQSAKGLDVSQCSASFTLPKFATSMTGWPNI